MGKLKHREYLNVILPIPMVKIIREMSKETKVPICRLVEEAIEDFLIKKKRM